MLSQGRRLTSGPDLLQLGMLAIAARGVRRLAWLPLIACALNGAPSSGSALAQAVGVERPRSQQPKTIPLPPPRPPDLGGAQIPPTELRTPSVEQALPLTPDTPTGLTPRPYEPPRETPQETPYERSAMRACGEEWQAMKRTGAASGKVWRDFAALCLRRKTTR